MGKSDLLRVQDVRDAYRLIGECRDLGNDPALWFPRMLEGLCELFGAFTATGGEGWWIRSRPPIVPISAFHHGLSRHDYDMYVAHIRRGGPAVDPIFRVLHRARGQLVTRTRRQIVSDTEWYRSALFNENFRVTGIDHRIVSLAQVSSEEAVCAIDLDRAAGDRDFSPRERRLLESFTASSAG
jgi:hypothetical protein